MEDKELSEFQKLINKDVYFLTPAEISLLSNQKFGEIDYGTPEGKRTVTYLIDIDRNTGIVTFDTQPLDKSKVIR